ncbi:leucine-rich repeat domain-containing protein [Cesiribacter sp. SM1]|uniref:leucine-rich repeat domain-containing protein n=1 Tax=Cesiribacter sp. SM1 TaxID=2861196 RepID=UPI001CD26D0B|nr:leucine-rich repeat domain-containing protein [Cesiribacter sp. SM1]
MTIGSLQQQLQEAYSIKNLNSISLTLIKLYKHKQFSALQHIANTISEFVDIRITAEGKGFSRLIMLYHPDRANYYSTEISKLAEQNNFSALLKHSHILKLERIEEIAHSLNGHEDIDYSPVYEWDSTTVGYSIIDDSQRVKRAKSKPKHYNFYDAIKLREYGHTNIEFPSYYLEDIDDFELSSSRIDNLDGVQFCLHAKKIDLSDNQITDLSLLEGLTYVEELNLSDNQVSIIDALASLQNLRMAFLANNQIEDISPLMDLENLSYVDLSGNSVSQDQISKLEALGVTVDY